MKVCAVIVAFNPPEIFRNVVERVVPQVSDVVIVNNGDEEELPSGIASGKVRVICFGRNRGVGAAHNAGIQWARERGNSHVLLLDHDSVPAPDMVDHLAKAIGELEGKGIPVAAVGPAYINATTRSTGFFVQFRKRGFKHVRARSHGVVPADFLISSGCLIPIRVLERIGLMDEGLFIDHVDTEWFLRAAANGYRAFGVCDATMEHTLGTGAIALVNRWVPEHAPIRHYYTFRNSLVLYRRPYARTRWITGDLLRLLCMVIFYPLVTPPRLEHLKMILLGVRDGIRGKTGPYLPASVGDN